MLLEKEDIIKLWVENKIKEATFNFTCGGDSMGDTEFEFFCDDKLPEEVQNKIEDFLDSEIYDHVTFYVNSSDEYLGERGYVTIMLCADGDEFIYEKNAISECSQVLSENITVNITQEEVDYIREYVSGMGGEDGTTWCDYKKDFIKSDELEELETNLLDKINEEVEQHQFNFDGTPREYYRWTAISTEDITYNDRWGEFSIAIEAIRDHTYERPSD